MMTIETGAEAAKEMEVMERFLRLLGRSQVITIDDGPLLRDWSTDAFRGEEDNHVVHFTWTDGEYDFGCTLDEKGIKGGRFSPDGTFLCVDTEGEATEIRMFAIQQLV